VVSQSRAHVPRNRPPSRIMAVLLVH